MSIKFVPPTPEELAARGLDAEGNPLAPAPKPRAKKKAEVVEETKDDDAV